VSRIHGIVSFLVLSVIACGAILSTTQAQQAGEEPKFKSRVGLQLYSLRDQFAKDVPGTLDKVRDMGIKYVELAGTYGMSPEDFRGELESRGLTAVSGHFPYNGFRDNLAGVVAEAKKLGLKYAGCAWIDHEGDFTEKNCRDAAEVFNRAGEALAAEGITFFYHTHGYEFQPHGDETLFDLLMAETKPEFVSYEMDVFWIVHPGQDPVTLLKKYRDRFKLTHLKDMKKDTPTGLLTGSSDPKNDVVIGTGKINFPPLLRACEEGAVEYHFIEDESPTSLEQIPLSLKYLQEVAL
jgi:sugar phosphate isomerase/epimerase